MNRTMLIAALALALSSVAQAQTAKAPAKKEAKAEAKAEVKAEAKKEAPAAVASSRKSRKHEDARHCLNEANNTAIIKCAEAYL